MAGMSIWKGDFCGMMVARQVYDLRHPARNQPSHGGFDRPTHDDRGIHVVGEIIRASHPGVADSAG